MTYHLTSGRHSQLMEAHLECTVAPSLTRGKGQRLLPRGRKGGIVLAVAGTLYALAGRGNAAILSASSVTAQSDGTAAVTLNVDSLTLAGLQATVKYDPALTLTDADISGGTLFSTSQITPNTQTKGTAYLAIAGNKNVQGPGSVATLTFHIPTSAQGCATYPITLSEASSNDQDGKTTLLWVQAGSIKVQPNPPVAANGSVTTDAGKAVTVKLSVTDCQNLPLTYSVVTPPVSGSLSGIAPNLTYTPNAGFTGSDSFTFKANNGTLDSNVATISITVNAPSVQPTLAVMASSGSPGSTATVGFTVNAFALAGAQFTVKYDPALTLGDADVLGGRVFSTSQITPNTQTAGTAYIAMAGNKNVRGPGTLVTLTFHLPAVAPVGKTYSIRLADAQANDEMGKTFTPGTVDGSIVTVIAGDLNGDVRVDAVDLSMGYSIFMGQVTPTRFQIEAGRRHRTRLNPSDPDAWFRSDDLNWLFRRFLGLETDPR